jgi:hypothetical protein
VVVNHPRTGERCYIDVQIPPGAPRVHYTSHSIEYDYGAKGLTIKFPRHGCPTLVHRNHVPIKRAAGKATKAVALGTADVFVRSGIAQHVGEVAQGATAFVCNTACYAESFGEQLLSPVIGIAKSTPLGSMVKRDPVKEADYARKLAVRKKEHCEDPQNETIPTLR